MFVEASAKSGENVDKLCDIIARFGTLKKGILMNLV